MRADDPNCDEHETELYSELSKGKYDDDVWSWLEQAIKQASGQTLDGVVAPAVKPARRMVDADA
jgi:hypothetical protein